MSKIIKSLMTDTGLPEFEIRKIISSAPIRYKTYPIMKKNGGTRLISQPAREVKLLQRSLIASELQFLPVHDSATAYRNGLSLLDNVKPHAGNGPILKLDLKNFFPSIRSQDWISYCKKTNIFEDEDVNLTSLLLFYREKGTRLLRLSIGAPSSPVVSNAIMYEFDSLVAQAVSKDQVRYTRYADDMTFSAPRTGYLTGVMRAVAQTIRSIKYPKLEINSEKTVYATSKYHRGITGLTLANDGAVTVGRKKKRELRSAVHHALLGKLTELEMQKLCGNLAFINSVEPEFLNTLSEKYGNDIIKSIQRFVLKTEFQQQ